MFSVPSAGWRTTWWWPRCGWCCWLSHGLPPPSLKKRAASPWGSVPSNQKTHRSRSSFFRAQWRHCGCTPLQIPAQTGSSLTTFECLGASGGRCSKQPEALLSGRHSPVWILRCPDVYNAGWMFKATQSKVSSHRAVDPLLLPLHSDLLSAEATTHVPSTINIAVFWMCLCVRSLCLHCVVNPLLSEEYS